MQSVIDPNKSPDPQLTCFTTFYYFLICTRNLRILRNVPIKFILFIQIVFWIWINQIDLQTCVFNKPWPLNYTFYAVVNKNLLLPPPSAVHSFYAINKRTPTVVICCIYMRWLFYNDLTELSYNPSTSLTQQRKGRPDQSFLQIYRVSTNDWYYLGR